MDYKYDTFYFSVSGRYSTIEQILSSCYETGDAAVSRYVAAN